LRWNEVPAALPCKPWVPRHRGFETLIYLEESRRAAPSGSDTKETGARAGGTEIYFVVNVRLDEGLQQVMQRTEELVHSSVRSRLGFGSREPIRSSERCSLHPPEGRVALAGLGDVVGVEV